MKLGNPILGEGGQLQANTGIAFSNAMASLGALDMDRGKQIMLAGTSMSVDRGRGGAVRITATSVDSTARGERQDYQYTGYLGAGQAVLMVGGALLTADRITKAVSPSKRGLFERAWSDGGSKASAFKQSRNESPNPGGSQNSKNPKGEFAPETGAKQASQQHGKSPSIQSRMTNYTTNTPESKGFFSDMAERILSLIHYKHQLLR
jgi:hypothetical protein